MSKVENNVQRLQASERSIELTRQLNDARSNQKKWGELVEYYRDELLEEVKEIRTSSTGSDDSEPKTILASAGTTVATISETTRKVFDRERFEADHPDINLENYQKMSVSVMVRTGNI